MVGGLCSNRLRFYIAVQPASTANAMPVTNVDSSEARNSAAAVISSPGAADGRIYAANETGTIVVFRAGDTLEVLARNDLGESITATPAIADDRLFVRSAKHLWAFGSS